MLGLGMQNNFATLDAQTSEGRLAQITTEENTPEHSDEKVTLENFLSQREKQERKKFERETEVAKLPPRKQMHPLHRAYLRQSGRIWAKGWAILSEIHRAIEPELARIRLADEMLIDVGR